jgi:predicted transcriptional regulator
MIATTKHHMVRVNERTHQALRELSASRRESMSAIIERAVDELAREEFFRAANEEWAAILADPVARAEMEAEDKLWEATLMDGLKDDPW